MSTELNPADIDALARAWRLAQRRPLAETVLFYATVGPVVGALVLCVVLPVFTQVGFGAPRDVLATLLFAHFFGALPAAAAGFAHHCAEALDGGLVRLVAASSAAGAVVSLLEFGIIMGPWNPGGLAVLSLTGGVTACALAFWLGGGRGSPWD